jgi:hypothetical protein
MMARRTFDESGHYYVKPFDVSIVESLDDGLGNILVMPLHFIKFLQEKHM